MINMKSLEQATTSGPTPAFPSPSLAEVDGLVSRNPGVREGCSLGPRQLRIRAKTSAPHGRHFFLSPLRSRKGVIA